MKKVLLIAFAAISIISLTGIGVYQTIFNKTNNNSKSTSSSNITLTSSKALSSKTASITCGDFTIKYNSDVHQVGLSFDADDANEYYFTNEEQKIAFIDNQKNFDPCANSYNKQFNLSLYSKGKKLLCYNCDQAWTPDILLRLNTNFYSDGNSYNFMEESRIISQQPINIPNVQNARIVTYKPIISINVDHIVKDLVFDYDGKSFLFGINAKDAKSGNHIFRSEYDPNSNYDDLLMDAISGLEINPTLLPAKPSLPFLKGSKTCGDFTFNFDANQFQVGVLDGIAKSFDSITGVEIKKPPYPDDSGEFTNYTRESRTCGQADQILKIYPKGYQLYCFKCDGNLILITFSIYNDEFEDKLEIVKVQNITKPFVKNASIRELRGSGRGPNKFHGLQFVFEYQGTKYAINDSYQFTLEDNDKAEVTQKIKNFEKIVEDFQINGQAGTNIWGKYILQTATWSCGDFNIKYDPGKYQVGYSYSQQIGEAKPYDEKRYLEFSKFVEDSKTCFGGFSGLYLAGTKPFCWQCDRIGYPSIVLTEQPEPVAFEVDNGSGGITKINSTKSIVKKSLQNAKIIDYEYGSFSRRKESVTALSFDYKGKHYLLQLQESRTKANSDFKTSDEYNKIFNELVDKFKVNPV